MYLISNNLRCLTLLAICGLAVLVAGCKLSGEMSLEVTKRGKKKTEPRSESITKELTTHDSVSDHTANTPRQSGNTGATSGFSLFGDHPDHEAVPFENRLITNLTQHTSTTEGLDFDPDVYDPEQMLVYASTRNSEHPDIFLKRIDGATLTQLTSDPADDIQPRFSPNGQQVAFSSDRNGNWDIWVINRDGTGLTQLTGDRTDEVAPCWSPDGSQIAYTLWGRRSRQWEIWTLSLAQPGVRHFLAYGMFPDWSPDGGRIAFQRARQRGSHLFGVWTVDLVGGEARHPTEVAHRDAGACIAPRWSPDGAMLVYCVVSGDPTDQQPGSHGPAAADLWVVEVESGIRMKLTDGAYPAFNPVWGAEGRVFFVSSQTGTENVWSLTTEIGSYTAGPPQPGAVSRAN